MHHAGALLTYTLRLRVDIVNPGFGLFVAILEEGPAGPAHI